MESSHKTGRHGRIAAALLCLAAIWPLANAAPAEDPAWAYRIQPGDNLFDISATYMEGKAGWRDLQRLNKVADPLKLPPGGTLKLPIRWLKREASVAQAVFAQGEVSLQRPPAPPAALKAGTELRSGDVLRTGEQASLTLRFVDGSRLLLAPRSEVTIEQLLVYGRSAIPAMQLRLHKGGADSRVQPAPKAPADYQLHTPSLNLGVRGTEFRVQLTGDGSGTRAQVLEGVVAAGPARVEAGYGVVADSPQAQPQVTRLLPAPDLRGLAPKLERIPLRLSWQAQDGAKAYRAQVYTAGNFEQLLLDGRFEQAQAQWPDLPDGRYSLRVRAIDALGLEGLAADAFFVLKARPEPPFARAPAPDANVYGNSVGLAWAKPLNAQAYRLQVASEPGFGSPLLDRSDLGASELDLALPHGRYFWRLATIALDPAGKEDLGPFGDPQSFTLKPVPPAPAPQPPEIGDDNLRLRWSAAPGMSSYQWQWAQDAEFKQLLQEGKTEQPEFTLPRPAAGSYYLRVRSVDAQGYAGPYGSAQQVDIPRSRWLWLLLPAGLLLLAL